MKLPDFYRFDGFQNLKRRMGIPAEQYGSFAVEIDYQRLSRRLASSIPARELMSV